MNTQQSNSRLIIIFFTFVSLYLFVLINLYIVQIKRAQFFKSLAQQQYTMTITTTPWRAEIFDRTGQPLALNKECLAAFITPSNLEDPRGVELFLAKHFKQAAERLHRQKKKHFLYIKRRLTPKDVEHIEKSGLSDIKILKEPSRFYPIQSVGPIIGITDIDNQGLFGTELMYNSMLAGKPSTYLIEKDCRSGHFYFTKETKVEGTQGKPITLTLDSVLQFLAYEELKEHAQLMEVKEGSVLILDPSSGDILVMANYPDFNHQATEFFHPDLQFHEAFLEIR